MAKFLKSIFHTTERKGPHYENDGEEEKVDTAQMGTRRQLSISRSGRLKQANKKRHSLALQLYGDDIPIDQSQRPTSVEYHVNSPSHTAPAALEPNTSRFKDITDIEDIVPESREMSVDEDLDTKLRKVDLNKSPEEEIDNAFEVIDKS